MFTEPKMDQMLQKEDAAEPTLQESLQEALKRFGSVDDQGDPIQIQQVIEVPKEQLQNIDEMEKKITPFIKDEAGFLPHVFDFLRFPIIIYSMQKHSRTSANRFVSELDAVAKKSANEEERLKYEYLHKMAANNKLKKNTLGNFPLVVGALAEQNPQISISKETNKLGDAVNKMMMESDDPDMYDRRDLEGKIEGTKLVEKYVRSFFADVQKSMTLAEQIERQERYN